MDKPSLQLVAEEGADAPSDDDLMLLVKGADRQDAFEILVRRHQSLVLGFATRFFGDRTIGRDVTQDAFLAVWAERARYKPRGRFRSYLMKVTRNRCHVVARQRRSHGRKVENLSRAQDAAPAVGGDGALALERMVAIERAREVRARLTELPPKTRQVLILRFTHDLPLAEIAELTGMPLGTVKSHVFRGLKRLHLLLGAGGGR